MSVQAEDRVLAVLRDAHVVERWTVADWEQFMRQARQADLVARVAAGIEAAGLSRVVPDGPRDHFIGFSRLVQAQHAEIVREAGYLQRALAQAGLPALLLKGAAYVVADLPPAAGRLFTDTDILVPRACLGDVESALMLNGWVSNELSAYDQRYYREWMHELPPMEHMRRRTALDVHHTILPPTARLKPDAGKILAAAVPVPGRPGIQVLAPLDMVLHSMTHLFHNEELSHGLRDLSDIDLLLRHFSIQRADFWRDLVERARELDLARPLHYGLRCAHRLLGTPVPGQALAAAARAAPAFPVAPLMDALWRRALGAQHPTAAPAFTPAALFLLYVRAHWLRMPPVLLIRHLAIKALARTKADKPAAA